MHRLGLFLLLLHVLALLGCSSEPQRALVQGSVTFEGKPVLEGTITFRPTEGTVGPTAGGTIQDGQYSIPAANGVIVGKHRVEIIGHRKTGKKVPDAARPGAMRDEMEQVIPERYNTQSELVKAVESGTNSIDFVLTAK